MGANFFIDFVKIELVLDPFCSHFIFLMVQSGIVGVVVEGTVGVGVLGVVVVEPPGVNGLR